ncbi:MAG: hypothetical protein JWN45_2938 [Acidobacteriaceae bacterium]|nr:hypothetical protein [Acidobacteriaceae bacterium]
MDITQAENIRQLRATILTTVYDNHRKQHSRLRLVQLAGVLETLFFDIALNDLVTVLQDLKERRYLEFKENKDRWTHRVNIGEIQITPKGRDLVERAPGCADPGVDFD